MPARERLLALATAMLAIGGAALGLGVVWG